MTTQEFFLRYEGNIRAYRSLFLLILHLQSGMLNLDKG